jgi:flagellar hook protein FlgE
MKLELYDKVILITNRFSTVEGVAQGALGYVIEIYEDGNCEVEFSDGDGVTYAQIVAKPEELEKVRAVE